MNEISKAPFQLKECFCPNKTKKMIKTIIALCAFAIPASSMGAVIFGAQVVPGGVGLAKTAGKDTTTFNVLVLKSDIDAGGGTYFNGTTIRFEIDDTNPVGKFNLENVEWQLDFQDNGSYDLGEIAPPGNFGPTNPVYDNSVYTGWDDGGLNLSGDLFNSEPHNFDMSLAGAALDSGLNANLFDIGDRAVGQAEFTVDGVSTLVNFSIEVVSSPVPEPSSTLLIRLGGMTLILRRKK